MIRPLCIECNLKFCCIKEKNLETGEIRFKNRCSSCLWAKVGYRKFKKKYCEKCGFVAKHRCQLDVDHVDGNRNNNKKTNLKTLCANCHRLKTTINRDSEKRYY